jgi:hypothetical protein
MLKLCGIKDICEASPHTGRILSWESRSPILPHPGWCPLTHGLGDPINSHCLSLLPFSLPINSQARFLDAYQAPERRFVFVAAVYFCKWMPLILTWALFSGDLSLQAPSTSLGPQSAFSILFPESLLSSLVSLCRPSLEESASTLAYSLHCSHWHLIGTPHPASYSQSVTPHSSLVKHKPNTLALLVGCLSSFIEFLFLPLDCLFWPP